MQWRLMDRNRQKDVDELLCKILKRVLVLHSAPRIHLVGTRLQFTEWEVSFRGSGLGWVTRPIYSVSRIY